MSRCVCCNKLLNDRELKWKDKHGKFRDTCQTCLNWIINPNQGEEVLPVEPIMDDEEQPCYDVYSEPVVLNFND